MPAASYCWGMILLVFSCFFSREGQKRSSKNGSYSTLSCLAAGPLGAMCWESFQATRQLRMGREDFCLIVSHEPLVRLTRIDGLPPRRLSYVRERHHSSESLANIFFYPAPCLFFRQWH